MKRKVCTYALFSKYKNQLYLFCFSFVFDVLIQGCISGFADTISYRVSAKFWRIGDTPIFWRIGDTEKMPKSLKMKRKYQWNPTRFDAAGSLIAAFAPRAQVGVGNGALRPVARLALIGEPRQSRPRGIKQPPQENVRARLEEVVGSSRKQQGVVGSSRQQQEVVGSSREQ